MPDLKPKQTAISNRNSCLQPTLPSHDNNPEGFWRMNQLTCCRHTHISGFFRGWATEVRTATQKPLVTDCKRKFEPQEKIHCQRGASRSLHSISNGKIMKDVVRVGDGGAGDTMIHTAHTLLTVPIPSTALPSPHLNWTKLNHLS